MTSTEVQIDTKQTPNQGIKYVPVTESEYWNYSKTGRVFRGDIELRGMDRYQGHVCNLVVMYHNADHEARRVFEGPVVKGEYIYLSPQATIISDPPQAYQERLAVAQGDLLLICGNLYEYFEGTSYKGAYLVKVEV